MAQSNEILSKKDKEYILRGWEYGTIIPFVEGKGAILKDANGKEYIDFMSGLVVLSTGHCHPKVVEAIKQQAEKLIQLSPFESSARAIEMAEKLATIAPGKLDKVYFSVTGGEAVEYATRLARQYKNGYELIALRGSYHGLTAGALSLTGVGHYRTGAHGPLVPGIYHAVCPYCYRCNFKQMYPGCDLLCAADIEDIVRTLGTDKLCGVILEPILEAGGGMAPPDEYFRVVKEICERHGLLFIDDEVSLGMGRTGKMFGIDHSAVTPDIMILGKSIGGGLPLSATLSTEEISRDFFTGGPTTFGGNALACAAGLAQIRVIEEENLCGRASEFGGYLLKRLNEMAGEHPLIGDVRGKGFNIAVELVKRRDTKEPAVDETKQVTEELKIRGVLALMGGLFECVLRLFPPLVITREQLDKALEIIAESIDVVERRFGYK